MKNIIISSFFSIFLIFIITRLSSSSNNNYNFKDLLNRSPKWLPFLAVIKFNYTACSTQNGEGVCLPHKTCMNKGFSLGTCAQGYGSCCLISKSCLDPNPIEINDNQTYIIQPNRTLSTCQYFFPKEKDVCQIKLDFVEGNIGESYLGNCQKSAISISGSSTVENFKNFKICGNLTGQHLYLAYGEESEKITIKIALERDEKYRVRVSQIKCHAERKVPDYCLQYYPNVTGNIQSFNYGNQLNNQKYVICIEPPGITHNLKLEKRDFFISGRDVEDDESNQERFVCDKTKDYVQVFGDKRPFCYKHLPQTLTIGTKPYLIYVHFDDVEAPIPSVIELPITNPTECSNYGGTVPVDCNPPTNINCKCIITVPANEIQGSIDIDNRGFNIDYQAF